VRQLNAGETIIDLRTGSMYNKTVVGISDVVYDTNGKSHASKEEYI